jgi:hypothetical protein
MSGYWMSSKLDRPDVDPQIPLGIGRIIMAWSRVEEALDGDIDYLAKRPNSARILPKSIPNAFGPRLDLWHRLVCASYPDLPLYLTAAKEIREAAEHLAEWRNNLTHGLVTVENGRLRIANIRRRGRVREVMVYRDIAPDELPAVSKDIERLEDEITAFVMNHFVLGTHCLEAPPAP